jgi:hypothetical protein
MAAPYFSVALKRAHNVLNTTGEDQIIYSKDNSVTTVPLKTYILLNIDSKKAQRICVISSSIIQLSGEIL